MPQIQVLPAVPSFGSKLAEALGGAGSQIAAGYVQGKDRKALEELLKNYQNPQPIAQIEGANVNNVPTSPPETLNPLDITKIHKLASRVHGEKGADVLIKGILEKEKLKQKKADKIEEENRNYERKLTETEQVPFFQKIASDRETIPHAIQANDQVIDAILKGDVGPASLASIGNIAKDLGVPASITKMLESPDSKEFSNGIKALYGQTIKDTFRGTTTQREIDIAQAMQAEIGVTREANLAAALAVKADLDIREEQIRIYNELVDKKIPRSQIPSIIEKRINPFRKQIKDEYFDTIDYLRKEVKK